MMSISAVSTTMSSSSTDSTSKTTHASLQEVRKNIEKSQAAILANQIILEQLVPMESELAIRDEANMNLVRTYGVVKSKKKDDEKKTKCQNCLLKHALCKPHIKKYLNSFDDLTERVEHSMFFSLAERNTYIDSLEDTVKADFVARLPTL
jgi:hypothetical protein